MRGPPFVPAHGYPLSIITNILKNKPAVENIPCPEELVGIFFKWTEPSVTSFDFACLPYVNGVTEPLQRLLITMEFEVVSRPYRNPQQEFPSPKFRPPSRLLVSSAAVIRVVTQRFSPVA